MGPADPHRLGRLSGVLAPGINEIDDDGVTFRSHIDGSKHRLTPEVSMEIQRVLGSDIAMVFDQCPPADADGRGPRGRARATTRVGERCKRDAAHANGQAVFGIVAGRHQRRAARRHMAEITALDFDGHALGGLAVGENLAETFDATLGGAPAAGGKAALPHGGRRRPRILA